MLIEQNYSSPVNVVIAQAEKATTDLRLKAGMVNVLLENGVDENTMNRIDTMTVEAKNHKKNMSKVLKAELSTFSNDLLSPAADVSRGAAPEPAMPTVSKVVVSESEEESSEEEEEEEVVNGVKGYLYVKRVLRNSQMSNAGEDDQEKLDQEKKRCVPPDPAGVF